MLEKCFDQLSLKFLHNLYFNKFFALTAFTASTAATQQA